MFEAYRNENADRLVLLGDLLYHGPRNDLPECYAPKRVIELLNSHADEIYCVRGNCDAEVDQMVLNFPIMADYALIPVSDRIIYVTHGHIHNTETFPPLKKGDILLHGHTHIPVCEEKEDYVYCNPGSVSIPKAGSSHGYMTLDGNILSWKTLDGQKYMEYKI